jgi:hypothetical protein
MTRLVSSACWRGSAAAVCGLWLASAAGLVVVFSQEGASRTPAATAPLPERESFLADTRRNVERARRDMQFSYVERRTELHMNPFGRIGSGDSKDTTAYLITPSPDGAVIERTLVERNGEPVANGEVTRRPIRPRNSRARRSAVDDAVATLEFSLDRREVMHGRNTIVVAFTPRPDARPETDEGKMAKSFRGEIWVDEALREIVHVEATAVDSLTYGLGMVARLNRGSKVVLTRDQVVPGSWQPTSVRFTGDGRALLFRKLHVDHVIEWFNYKRVGDGLP